METLKFIDDGLCLFFYCKIFGRLLHSQLVHCRLFAMFASFLANKSIRKFLLPELVHSYIQSIGFILSVSQKTIILLSQKVKNRVTNLIKSRLCA